MQTTFTENFPQIWPLSCIFPLLTGVGCLPLTLKKKPGLSQSLVLPCVCHCIFRLFLNDFYMRSTNSGFIWMLFIKLCLQYCSTVYMYSVFCLKNEQRHQGPPLPRLEAESSLGTWK